LLIEIVGQLEDRRRLAGQGVVFALARGTAADEVKSEIMGSGEQEGACVAGAVEQVGPAGDLSEDLLQQVARVGLVARQVQQEREQRLRMPVVELFQRLAHLAVRTPQAAPFV